MSTAVPVSALRRVCDPFKQSPWSKRVTRAMVAARLEREDFCEQPLDGNPDVPAEQHARRIAFFVRFGWTDPIEIDVGVPSLGCVVDRPVQDGNHRLAAAIYRGQSAIGANVSGSISYAAELLCVSEQSVCPEVAYR